MNRRVCKGYCNHCQTKVEVVCDADIEPGSKDAYISIRCTVCGQKVDPRTLEAIQHRLFGEDNS